MSTAEETILNLIAPFTATPTRNGIHDEDPSAANAVMDDGDWEPVTMTTTETTNPTENGEMTTAEATAAEAQVTANVQEVLNAVDDLLAETGSVASDTDDSPGNMKDVVSTSNDDKATTTTTTAEVQQQEQGKRKKESPLKLRKRLKAARAKLQKSLNLKQRVMKPVAQLSVHATRKMVTGSKETRVRDFVIMPRVVRVLDKWTFTFGIMGMLVTEFVVLEFPTYFRYFFVTTMLPLLMLRVVLFQRTKQQYFLLDFCYWVNGLGFVLTIFPFIFPNKLMMDPSNYEEYNDILWQIFFVSSNGPLFFAMIAWNNSLVFHSVDKVTSTYVHLFPALLSLCERWRSNHAMNNQSSSSLPIMRHLGYPMMFYCTWQMVYLIQTEWLHKDRLEADPELSTSLRYLTSAEKMAINKKTLKLCRTIGLMGPTETFNPPTLKVKFIFVILQAIMTIMTFAPVRLFYEYKWIHYFVVVGILTFSVYNGARYYIQVFSKIYEKRYNDAHVEEEEYIDTSAVMTEHTTKKKD